MGLDKPLDEGVEVEQEELEKEESIRKTCVGVWETGHRVITEIW